MNESAMVDTRTRTFMDRPVGTGVQGRPRTGPPPWNSERRQNGDPAPDGRTTVRLHMRIRLAA